MHLSSHVHHPTYGAYLRSLHLFGSKDLLHSTAHPRACSVRLAATMKTKPSLHLRLGTRARAVLHRHLPSTHASQQHPSCGWLNEAKGAFSYHSFPATRSNLNTRLHMAGRLAIKTLSRSSVFGKDLCGLFVTAPVCTPLFYLLYLFFWGFHGTAPRSIMSMNGSPIALSTNKAMMNSAKRSTISLSLKSGKVRRRCLVAT